MIEDKVTFHSDGCSLAGAFYLPEEATATDDARSLIVVCSGFMGLRNIHPERFARSLTVRGYPCFGFDYRGFGPSGGTPGRVVLDEQVRDIRNAATFAAYHRDLAYLDDGSERPIVLVGWGMGAGLVLQAARGTPRLQGLVCINGFYNAQRVQRAVRGEADWQAFQEWMLDQRRTAVASADPCLADPFQIYPLDPTTREYVDNVLRKNPDFGGEVHAVLADSLIDFQPEKHLDGLTGVPVLIAHGDQNALHPPKEAEVLYQLYPGKKELYWIPGGGHTEWMDDNHPLYLSLVDHLAGWLKALP